LYCIASSSDLLILFVEIDYWKLFVLKNRVN